MSFYMKPFMYRFCNVEIDVFELCLSVCLPVDLKIERTF